MDMLKRMILLALALCLCVFSVVQADDFSIYTTEYLLKMKAEIEAELARREISEPDDSVISEEELSVTDESFSRYIYKYRETIEKAAAEYNLNPALVAAVILNESGFRADADSGRARGLMQLSKQTAEWVAGQLNLSGFNYDMMYDPETNIRFGCWLLNQNGKRYNGNTICVMAAYSNGHGTVNAWLADPSISGDGKTIAIDTGCRTGRQKTIFRKSSAIIRSTRICTTLKQARQPGYRTPYGL